MRESLACWNSKVEAAKTYKKFCSDTCDDSDAYEQEESTPGAELRLLFLFLNVMAMSITWHIAGFNIKSRRT